MIGDFNATLKNVVDIYQTQLWQKKTKKWTGKNYYKFTWSGTKMEQKLIFCSTLEATLQKVLPHFDGQIRPFL